MSPSRVWEWVAGSGLLLALLVVLALDRRSVPAPVKAEQTLEVRLLTQEAVNAKPAPKRLRLAVVPSRGTDNFNKVVAWDDMGRLLNELGDGYRFDTIEPRDIAQRKGALDHYDVLFLTCSRRDFEMHSAIRDFVSRGGVLYASDWRFEVVASAFPDLIDREKEVPGAAQEVRAEVLDPRLRDLVGPTIPLHFDLDNWKTAAFKGSRVTTLLQGRIRRERLIGNPWLVAPLLVRFQFGKGTVIFTSFHNEKQNSDIEKKLLQYLVFSLVTAEEEAKVTASIQEAGFSPQSSNLLSGAKESPSVTRTHLVAREAALRFAIGFRDEGALMRLTLRAPDGRSHTWEGTSTAILEVPRAMPGEWTYSVTAVRLPYENFPFTVTVSEKKP